MMFLSTRPEGRVAVKAPPQETTQDAEELPKNQDGAVELCGSSPHRMFGVSPARVDDEDQRLIQFLCTTSARQFYYS